MIDFSAFADELQKIAAKRSNRGAIYSPVLAAHEAGHALVHKTPGVTTGKMMATEGAKWYSGGRLVGSAIMGGGMSPAEAGAISAVGNIPVLADEAASSYIGLKKLKDDKKMTKSDWKKAALQLAAVNSSYLASPLMDAAMIGASKAGLHPLAQLGLKLALKPVAQKGWAALGMMVKGPKVTAKRAKEIVDATAPGTPVFAIKEGIPGGSLYVPPAGKSKLRGEIIDTSYGGVMTRRDLGTLRRKGGVLLAPLDPKVQARSILPGRIELKSKFRRVT